MGELEAVNAGLAAQGVRGRVVEHDGALYWRATVTTADGRRGQRRVHLGLQAVPGTQRQATARVVQLAAAIEAEGHLPDPLPWARPAPAPAGPASAPLTCAHGIERFEEHWWTGRARTTAAERSWDRLMTELRRLPPGAELTADLLAAVVELRPANSRGRLEAAKVFKALGRLLNLEGLEQLDALRGSYEPADRNLPTDVVLLEFVRAQREDPRWGWATAALLAYGCRPAELFSLQPRADGTATCLTVKRKSKLPATRTAMALPPAWVEELELLEVSRPLNWNRPADYDSAEARRQVLMWGKWMGRKGASFALYDMRHAWAVRSIRMGLNASLAARCLGHSLAVHHTTYHRWLSEADVAAVAVKLRKESHPSV